ncbi:antibiotic biosynthesis monooxygenase family protein [Alkalilacustris brevis]|uniref:antibiotic biosynthesis monooxygenase family protein n=1 Tax=Alkalilacustris brevis TaxID=2026338 RepID=UPI000E0D4262|nr:antibiotic biosynthesis monooxygenase [Alkalilacustris brevis]
MPIEIARIKVREGCEAEFEKGVAKAAPLFQRARGCLGMELRRLHEPPRPFMLVVRWETLENHTEDFRNSEDFQTWRALVSPYFAEPPQVEHLELCEHHF